MRECVAVELGMIPYGAALEVQRRLVAARKAGLIPDVLLLCQHPHVITLGRNGKSAHLLASSHLLRQMNVEFFESDRGGDITYHGPGQLVGYPILKLSEIRRDVGWYMRQLEETMIRASADFGLRAERRAGMTGIWVSGTGTLACPHTEPVENRTDKSVCPTEEKLGAIGVHLSRWVTSHGFAYNVSTDLRYFDLIVPCGLTGKRATSLERIAGRSVSMTRATESVVENFAAVFEFQMRSMSLAALESDLTRGAEAPALEAVGATE